MAVRRIFGTGSLKYALFSIILGIPKSSERYLSCQDLLIWPNATNRALRITERQGSSANPIASAWAWVPWHGQATGLSPQEWLQGAQSFLSPSFNTSRIFKGLVPENRSSLHSLWASQQATLQSFLDLISFLAVITLPFSKLLLITDILFYLLPNYVVEITDLSFSISLQWFQEIIARMA